MIRTEIDDAAAIHMIRLWAEGVMRSRPWNEIIERHGSPYIERTMLGRKMMIPTLVASRSRIAEIGPQTDDPTPIPSEIENLFLHRYKRNDFEDYHCHPWDNGTLVAHGRLVEEAPDEDGRPVRHALLPGDVVFRKADQRHRIVEVSPGTITLFGTGPKWREWGFWPDVDGVATFVHHREYRQWKIDRGLETDGNSYGGGK